MNAVACQQLVTIIKRSDFPPNKAEVRADARCSPRSLLQWNEFFNACLEDVVQA